jgi:hypothetical protein
MDLDGVCVRAEEVGGRLVLTAGDEHASEFIAKLTRKKDVIVSIRSPRNPDHHKYVFAWFKKIIDNTDNIWRDVEELLEAVKFATGHTTRFRRITNPHAQDMVLADKLSKTTLYCADSIDGMLGGVEPLPVTETAKIIMALRRGSDEYITRTRSISFASMSEEKFKAFHDRAVLALNTFLGWDTTQLMRKENETP